MLFLILRNAFLDFINSPPGAMLFIMEIALTTSIISSLLTMWLVDTGEIERKQKQIKAHQEEKEKIIEIAEEDSERYRKLRKRWERKDAMLKQTQQRMAMQRLKPTCITFLPMIIIFGVIRSFYRSDPVALSPMNANDIPLIGPIIAAGSIFINFTAWYFLCSLGFNTLIQRVLKLQTQASGGAGGMFSGQKAKSLEFPDV